MDFEKYRLFRSNASAAIAVHMAVSSLNSGIKPCHSSDAIYQPGKKAGEYAKYACSIYVGCPGGCEYCYRDDPPLATAIGGSVVRLKEILKSEPEAIEIYFRELFGGNGGEVRPELLRHGIFFTFTSDPGLPRTFPLVAAIIAETVKLHVPVQFLTKFTGWMDSEIWQDLLTIPELKQYLAIGFTLTGCDDHEPGASPNEERIKALGVAHKAGFKTFASIEPIIDTESSFTAMSQSGGYVDLYRVGLQSHRKYDTDDLAAFVYDLELIPWLRHIYLKDSLVTALGRTRESFSEKFVNVDFTPFDA